MTSIQRYDAWPQEWPFEDEHGDLVTYEDHRKIVDELEDKLSGAKDFLKMHTAYSDADCRTIIKKVIAELSSTMKGQDDAE